MTLEIITSEVLKLDRLSRIELIKLVLDSIAREETTVDIEEDAGLTEEQAKEIERRLARYDSGETKAIPGEVVHAEIAKKYGLQLSTPS